MEVLKIEYVPLDQIKPYERNPRRNDAAADEVAKSIKEFGFKVPIIIDGSGEIIAGHTRYKAATKLQLDAVPVIRAEDLSEDQVKAFRIADNKSSEYAEWDMQLLFSELEELKLEGYDINLTGFSEDEYLQMIDDLADEENPPEPEDFDLEKEIEKIQESSVKPGQIYKLGRHYLMCGDSTDENQVRKLMSASGQEVKAAFVWTDPPYNVDYEDDAGRKILNDNMSDEKFKEFLVQIFRNYDKFTEDNCAFYVCYASKEHRNFENAMNENQIFVRTQIIWVKNIAVLSFAHYKWKHEPIFYAAKSKGSLHFHGDRKNTTVWIDSKEAFIQIEPGPEQTKVIKIKGEGCSYYITVDCIKNIEVDSEDNTTVWEVAKESNYVHPNQKPLKLIRKAIRNSSRPGDIMLELFGGSGSTLMAAEETERTCYSMELDPVYCEVIIKRFESATGIKAELLDE